LGNLDQNKFFIYAACDVAYFNEFGPTLINSVLQNTTVGIHLHLYNPTTDQIKYCRTLDRVSITYEYAPLELFETSAQQWATIPTDPTLEIKYRRTLNSMKKGKDSSILERMQKTYFACARFIRLQHLIQQSSKVLAIDVDAVVRKNIPMLDDNNDLYIHRITNKDPRFLAGAIYLAGTYNSYQFLKEYATVLKNTVSNDFLYWSVDQDLLEDIVPKYHWAQMPRELIDWEMQDSSCIWTAKGTRKDLQIFIDEKNRYKS
jgi:hypothetical protein